MAPQQLPDSGTALTMGILSIVLTILCCGPFGMIFSFIGLSYAKSAERTYLQDPSGYIGYENVKTARILSYIGLGLSLLLLLFTILYFGLIVALITTGSFDGDF